MSSLLDAPPDDFVAPAYLSFPDHVKSYGDDVADFGAAIGRPMDDEQRLVLQVMYAVREDGTPAAFEVAVIAARQNLKTATMEVSALYDLYVVKSPLGIWSAHVYDTTAETFLNMKAIIEKHDFLDRRTNRIIEAPGNQFIETHDVDPATGKNCRIRFRARSLTGGRGLTTKGRLYLDEAFALQDSHMGSVIPTMATVRTAQVVYGSSSGRAESQVLRGVRDRGRAKQIGYAEWSAPRGGCRKPDCRHEKKLDPAEREAQGCALDDPKTWRAANPSMEWPGRRVWRITQEYIANERMALTPLEFGRERAGWWDEPGLMSLFAGWDALIDRSSSIAVRLAWAITVPPDRSRAVIAAAGLRAGEEDFIGPVCEDCQHESCHGDLHVEPIEIDNGTGWVVDRMRRLVATHGKHPIGVAAGGQAASLIAELRRAGLDITELDSGDVMDADSQLFDAVDQGTVRHMSYPELDAAIERAQKRPVGKRWVFDAREPEQEVSVLQAVSQASWVSRHVQPRELKPMFAYA